MVHFEIQADESERAKDLLGDQMLEQDVCVPAVLSELAQHVQVHPAQRERAAPVAVEQVVRVQR